MLLLIKNPAGANEVLRILPGGRQPRCCSRSTTASPTAATSRGSGTSTGSSSPRACGTSSCSGTRAGDAALRLKYAGVDAAAIEVVPDIADALDRLAELAAGGSGYVLPTYTAMLELQRIAARRGLSQPYWEAAAA